VDLDDARAVAESCLDLSWLFITRVQEFDVGWVFFYDSIAHEGSGAFRVSPGTRSSETRHCSLTGQMGRPISPVRLERSRSTSSGTAQETRTMTAPGTRESTCR